MPWLRTITIEFGSWRISVSLFGFGLEQFGAFDGLHVREQTVDDQVEVLNIDASIKGNVGTLVLVKVLVLAEYAIDNEVHIGDVYPTIGVNISYHVDVLVVKQADDGEV